MKKNKKKIILGTVLSLSVAAFLLIAPESTKAPSKNITKTKKNKDIPKTKVDRAPASLPIKTPPQSSAPPTPLKKRDIIGQIYDQDNLLYTNKVSENWEEIYKQGFFRHTDKDAISDFNIKLKRSVLKVKKNSGTYLEHVVVSYTMADGSPFSFEALINSETGVPVQTWNKTHSEYRKTMKLKNVNAYYGD